ncbi:DNA/RNA nuclease SfsA [Fibrobacter sp. UWEL]|uniref:DNA/RNA nuclease SfsA n=1 Tax=Fibrobacter sp. UWEL TaxID=1896209 RepID=UPI00092043CB|nr:DNA/RNA nuclease SfsA [Fibrobacter sp. UWEL]SHL43275.1 sugar fermentation stimulation protein A [Fibrobacter sp. UWEL]
MKYSTVVPAKFISRPNRFIAHVEVNGVDTVVHVKNTGRCKELLVPGCTVYLEKPDNPARKTPYDLIAVEKVVPDATRKSKQKTILINMDSQAPNKVAAEWIRAHQELFPKITFLKPEYTYGNSRFDFYVEFSGRKMFIEVKGCTLEFDGHAKFPDAPTERGVKHLTELADILRENRCAEDGTPYECGILFLIQMKGCHKFSPNVDTHPQFGVALKAAQDAGVKIFVYDCKVKPDTLVSDIPVALEL